MQAARGESGRPTICLEILPSIVQEHCNWTRFKTWSQINIGG
jgi:hypothetical protein